MRRPVTFSPSKLTVAGARLDEPEDGLQRRRLPGGVAAEDRDELTRPDLDLHVLEDVDQAVERVDPGELEQGLGAAVRGGLVHFVTHLVVAAFVPR